MKYINWMRKYKQQNLLALLISFIFIFIISILFTQLMVDKYHTYQPDGQSYSIVFYFIQVTHLNIIFMTIWVSLLLIMNQQKKELNFNINNLFLSISLLVGVFYFPGWVVLMGRDFGVLLTDMIPSNWDYTHIPFSPEAYVAVDAIQTTLCHIFLPLIAIAIYLTTTNKVVTIKTPFINLSFITVYYIIAVILVSVFNIEDPYNIFDYSSSALMIVFNIVSAIFIVGLYFSITYVQYYLLKRSKVSTEPQTSTIKE